MSTKSRIAMILSLAFFGFATLAVFVWAASPDRIQFAGGAPTIVSYQGQVTISGNPYSGEGYFKFTIIDAGGSATFWSNDGSALGTGSNEPSSAVPLVVERGIFSVLLGDTSLTGMTEPLDSGVFSDPDRYLRVWFSTSESGPFSLLAPDTRIAAVPYAFQAQEAVDAGRVDGYEGADLEESIEIDSDIAAHTALPGAHHTRYNDSEAWAAVLANDGSGSSLDADTVDGIHASELIEDYQNVLVVAQSGGDYSSVQAAIDSVTDATQDNPYLVWVAPGVYSETVKMKPFIHLQGAGQDTTLITSTVSNSSTWPPTAATLALSDDTSLRDLTLGNSGANSRSVTLIAMDSATRTLVSNVTVLAQAVGQFNYGILFMGENVVPELLHITVISEKSSGSNIGLRNQDGASTRIVGSTFKCRGGASSIGIANNDARLLIEKSTLSAENGNSNSTGLSSYGNSTILLLGGSYLGRGEGTVKGIHNISGTLTAHQVVALGENTGSIHTSYGLTNSGGSITLYGGSLTGRGGTQAHGIWNNTDGSSLQAIGITALGENGTNINRGLYNFGTASALLYNSTLIGRGGDMDANGIDNYGSNAILTAYHITALGENNLGGNSGLSNYSGSSILTGGSFIGIGGTNSRGISNGSSGTITAEFISVLAAKGSIDSYGFSSGTGTTTITHSVLEGADRAISNGSGSATVSHSQLIGGSASASVTCVAVSRGTTFNANGCP